MIPVFEQEGCRWKLVDEVKPYDTIAQECVLNGEYFEDCQGDERVQDREFTLRFEVWTAGRLT